MNLGNFGVEVKEENKNLQQIIDSKLDVNFEDIRNEFSLEDIERFLPWFLKYKLKSFEDIIVTKEISTMKNFIENFKPGKGLLLAGNAGSGKTTTLTLLSEYYDYELFEINASDTRNKKSIQETIGDVIKQKSLFGKNKLILVDEADGVSGRHDRGGVSELSKFVKQSKYPIVFTANDKESDKIKNLKKVCTYIDFENHSFELLIGIGNRILTSEKIKYSKEDLQTFVEERNTTDIRGFINDLQASVFEGKFDIGENILEIRDYKKKIENLLNTIYYSYPEDSQKGSYNSDINLDDLILYLEENTPNVVNDNKSLISAFNEIAKADVFRGRIMKWQHWRYLVYVNFYLTYGVSNFLGNNVKKLKTDFKRNSRILSKWIYSNKMNSLSVRTKTQKNNGDEEKFIEKLAKIYSRSANKTRKEDVKYFAFMYINSEKFRNAIDENGLSVRGSRDKLEINDSIRKSLIEL